MAPHAAYTVFRGKVPGVYMSLEECNKQIEDYPKPKYVGYKSLYEAQLAWADWSRKLEVKLGASTFLKKTAANPRPAYAPSAPVNHTNRFDAAHLRTIPVPRLSDYKSPPPSSSPMYSSSVARPPMLDTPPPSSSPLSIAPAVKRPAYYIDISDDEMDFKKYRAKKSKTQDMGMEFGYRSKKFNMDDSDYEIPAPVLTREDRFELDKLDKQKAPGKALVVEEKVELTPEQEKVVNLALKKHNIFLTGAAGSGKTVTLKEILFRIRKRRKDNKVQVIAPTGIAALPLGGKTTYSFAGWNPDSFRDGIVELLKKNEKKTTRMKEIREVDVLVIEEISMVENQFLERLNLLLRMAMANNLPFGGKQVVFLGDFHQLPPVKPFKNCLWCGHEIPQKEVKKCTSQQCNLGAESGSQIEFRDGDKWAFKSSVWSELKLRHIKLEQIHRQKDTSFQDILNKIRNGITLTVDEWSQLERPKDLPKDAYAVRLMSRLAQVQAFNEQKLAELTSQPKTWRAQDSAAKLISTLDGHPVPSDPAKEQEFKNSLRDHRYPESLTLKVGARVVLLQNLDHDRGLVNGSQGVVIGFAPAPHELAKIQEHSGPYQAFQEESLLAFKFSNKEMRDMRPLVRFANGQKELITAMPQSSLRGNVLNKMEQYVVTRTQVPLALAWALSIHKSQGMTLEYVEVLSKDIFEKGQLYVALSRATHLGGLRVTGFRREQLPMDEDVLKFYNETQWEGLDGKRGRKKKELVNDAAGQKGEVIDLT